MRYKISHSSSNKRERDRVSLLKLPRNPAWRKLQLHRNPHCRSVLRIGDRERSGVIHNGACPTPKGRRKEQPWMDLGTSRSCKSGDASPWKLGIIKEKLGRSIHVDPPGSCMAAPDDRDKSNFLVSRPLRPFARRPKSAPIFPWTDSLGNSVIADEDRARCEMEREREREDERKPKRS